MLGSVPLTITKRTKKLRDREDDIFQLWCWLFNTTAWLVWPVYLYRSKLNAQVVWMRAWLHWGKKDCWVQGSVITWWMICCGIDIHCHVTGWANIVSDHVPCFHPSLIVYRAKIRTEHVFGLRCIVDRLHWKWIRYVKCDWEIVNQYEKFI